MLKDGNSIGLSDATIDRFRELRQSTSQYDQKVLAKRNTLGHVRESEGPEGWILEGGDISLADFPDLRQTFAEHVDAFREMIDIIHTLDDQQPE